MAMRLMGEQFVCGETIEEALANSRARRRGASATPTTCSARPRPRRPTPRATHASYEQAIHAIGNAAARRGIYDGPGISIKLSALHPRYTPRRSASA